MKILSLEHSPITEIFFQSAGPRGKAETARLPIFRGTADSLPTGVTSLLITSDLQGLAPLWSAGGEARLLGEVLAEQLSELQDIPELSRLGVILCGDLFSAPDAAKRGASGDVTSVWGSLSATAQAQSPSAAANASRSPIRQEKTMLRISLQPCQSISADALLLPVDGVRPALGGAAGRAVRAALPAAERTEILEELDEDLLGLAPIRTGQAKALGPIARWDHLLVAAGFLHNVADTVFTSSEHAAAIGSAIQSSLVLAEQVKAHTLVLAPIGTGARVDVSTALRTLLIPLFSKQWKVEVVLSLIDEPIRLEALRLMNDFGLSYRMDADNP